MDLCQCSAVCSFQSIQIVLSLLNDRVTFRTAHAKDATSESLQGKVSRIRKRSLTTRMLRQEMINPSIFGLSSRLVSLIAYLPSRNKRANL